MNAAMQLISTSSQDEHSNDISDVNLRTKATLTALLNTESTRADEKYRSRIQESLIHIERRIRQQRRRRSGYERKYYEVSVHSTHTCAVM